MVRTFYALLLTGALGASSAYAQTDEQIKERLTSLVRTCEHAPDNGGTLGQALCYRDEAARQDKELNRKWVRIVGLISPARLVSLRRSERQWIKDRNEDCRVEASDYINSTAAYMFNVCMTDETIRRMMWLEQLR